MTEGQVFAEIENVVYRIWEKHKDDRVAFEQAARAAALENLSLAPEPVPQSFVDLALRVFDRMQEPE
jgi:hypothetical protein